MRLRILGTVRVHNGDSWRTVPAAKQRTLLALLVLHPDRMLDRDWLIETLWAGNPPSSAAGLLAHYMWRLRTLLPADVREGLQGTGGGYVFTLGADATDHQQFQALQASARTAEGRGDLEPAMAELTRALDLWSGPALSDARTLPLLASAAGHLDQLRVEAAESLAELQLACGRHLDALPALRELTATEPYRERPWMSLLTALHRAGRRTDALSAYQRLWRTWTEQLGIEPSQELKDLHLSLIHI